MTNSNNKKNIQLGMPYGTATQRLRKMIMFNLIQKLGLDICFQCGERIKTIEELSIEHKIPWLDSENPVKLFFDLDNIAFSHLKCNIGASKSSLKGTLKHPSSSAYKKGCRCLECTKIETKRKKSNV